MGTFAVGSKVQVIKEGDELRPEDRRQELGVIGIITQNITAVAPRTIDQAVIQRSDGGSAGTSFIIATNDAVHLQAAT